jgi:hypothetical protein
VGEVGFHVGSSDEEELADLGLIVSGSMERERGTNNEVKVTF